MDKAKVVAAVVVAVALGILTPAGVVYAGTLPPRQIPNPGTLLLFTSGFGGFEPKHFWLTFFFLGLTPVTIKTLTNYALELAEADQHPLYVSTLHACLAVPFVLSPLVGWLVDLLRFERVFLGISGVIALGWLASLRLVEPRHHSPSEKMS